MMIPSIDICGGRCVQLRSGEELLIDAGDPIPLIKRFGKLGSVAVIDLDAARGEGDNRELILQLVGRARCHVGGGIRSVESARAWLDAGAEKVILGTAARPELLRELPRERVIVALDASEGEVVVEGWRRPTGKDLVEALGELNSHAAEFLVTFVETEGSQSGLPIARIRDLIEHRGSAKLRVAGGLRSLEEIARLDAWGCDVQVGMALYSGALDLVDAYLAPTRAKIPSPSLVPTIVSDAQGRALGLCWSNEESLRLAIAEERGVFWSRSRDRLWRKGEESGATQRLLGIDLDCDRDVLRMRVEQSGVGFCHEQRWSCFSDASGLVRLERTLRERLANSPSESYVRRLFADDQLLGAKILEEAREVVEAETAPELRHEVADLFFFALAKMVRDGISLDAVEEELDRRALVVTRRDERKVSEGRS